MLTVAPQTATDGQPSADGDGGSPRRRWPDLAVPLVYLLGGIYLNIRLWADPTHRLQTDNIQDQGFFQFVLAHAARSVTHLSNPLFEGQVNWPDGVNMMANTSVLGLAIPLTPVTLLFGPGVAFALLVTLATALTASTWYHVLSRYVVESRGVAFVAAAFIGFSPGFVSQSNGHPNVAGQFLVPLILLQVAKLRDSARPVRTGLVLGLLVTFQAFINEEVLLFTAVAAALMVVVFGLARRAELRAALPGALRGLATAGVLVAVLLAYPLWFQFFGPQHYRAVPALSISYYSDLGSYFNYPGRSIGGAPSSGYFMISHPAEQNSFYGWPLLILVTVIAIWQWRRPLARVAAVTAVFFAAMSLGRHVMVYKHNTGIPGPIRLVDWLPVIDSVVPIRVALMVIPAVGVLLAIGLEQVLRARPTAGPPRSVWLAVFVAALLPLFPIPLQAKAGPAEPRFIAAGTWRQYVGPGQSVVLAPLPNIGHLDGQRWSAAQRLDMPIAGGYFLGPGARPTDRALYGAVPRPTYTLLNNIEIDGRAPAVTEVDREHMIEDLRYWRAAVVVVDPGARHPNLVRSAVTDLLQTEPQVIDGAWVWDVRSRMNG
jgi:hypothetical protein